MSLERAIKKVAEYLGLEEQVIKDLVNRRVLRYIEYKDLPYIVFRREWKGFREGTVIIIGSTTIKVIHGYPSIQRILLLKAVQRHFIDQVIVEEKMDGYNVRVVFFEDRILAITRGGYICPYTTARLKHMYEEEFKKIFKRYDEDLVLCGEVVGEENPYVQHYYPEAPYFDYFVFDIMRGKSFVKIKERDNIINNTKVKLVRRLGVIGKDDLNTLQHIVRRLERDCREGIVLKDPEHRVKPLKYTTTCTHLNDLELGMKYPFDEGRSFLFSRILREIWKIYEEGIDEKELAERAKALGLAILKPALESINRLREDKAIYEEYTIRVPDIRVLDDFIEYMDKLGVNIALAQVTPLPDGQVKARIIKMKNTDIEFRRILRTGYSPID